ncbi:hypothetical protein [Kitasatospora sp. NPDC092286]|uniref:hypothetical protein n=1 Tax=Kitasatospora sp. NPDC092286 TaxID=3364087 RepID=UPI003829E477
MGIEMVRQPDQSGRQDAPVRAVVQLLKGVVAGAAAEAVHLGGLEAVGLGAGPDEGASGRPPPPTG